MLPSTTTRDRPPSFQNVSKLENFAAHLNALHAVRAKFKKAFKKHLAMGRTIKGSCNGEKLFIDKGFQLGTRKGDDGSGKVMSREK